MTTEPTDCLSRFAIAPLSGTDDALNIARLSALDWMAVGRAGAAEPVSKIVRDMVLAEGAGGGSSVFGSIARVPARAAALSNGTTSHALDYDDTHFGHIGHPSVAVFPAALAIAEDMDADLADLLAAALVGMEASIRIGLWLGRAHYQVGFHQTATAGAFGAAVAAGRLLGLDQRAMAHALGLTATRAAGLKAQFGTMGKPYNAGLAASAGVEAAQLAARGFTANPDALGGSLGFGETHHGEGNLEALRDGLGQVWHFETVSHKFHACCHGLHATLEALREIDVAAPEVSQVTVQTHPRWMTVCNQPFPDTGLGAKFSYGTVVAMQILGIDTARIDSFNDAICARPDLRDLRGRVRVIPDEKLPETGARIEVLRRDGSRLAATHDLLAPMDFDDRLGRVRDKAAALIGRADADACWSLVKHGGPVAGFAALMRGQTA